MGYALGWISTYLPPLRAPFLHCSAQASLQTNLHSTCTSYAMFCLPLSCSWPLKQKSSLSHASPY